MKKQYIFGIVMAIIIISGFVAYPFYQNYKYEKAIISEKDRSLNAEDKKIYEDRLAAINNQMGSANDDQKFSLYLQQGFNLYGLGKLAEAKLAYQKSIELKPKSSQAYVALYQTEVEMNDYKEALKNIQKASELESGSSDIWKKYIQLEIDKVKSGNKKIKSLFVLALDKTKTDPSYPDMISYYATWLEGIGDKTGAKEQWQRAIEANPSASSTYQAEIDRLGN
jgi:tetratricopeptide (TPR) repeat protein